MAQQQKKTKKSLPPVTPECFVLDACAIIAYLNGEAGAGKVEGLIERAKAEEAQLHIMSINVYEVYYDALRRNPSEKEKAEELLNDVYGMPLMIVETIDRTMMRHAGHFKITYKMSVADSFALALAKIRNAKVVTTDHHELDAVEKSGELQFFWLR